MRCRRKRHGDFLFSVLIVTSCVVQTSHGVVRDRVRFVHGFLHAHFNVRTRGRKRRVLLNLFRQTGRLRRTSPATCQSIVFRYNKRVTSGLACRRHLRLLCFLVRVTRDSKGMDHRRMRTLGSATHTVQLSRRRIVSVFGLHNSSLSSTCGMLRVSTATASRRIEGTFGGLTLGRRPSGMTALNRSIHQITRRGFRRVGGTGRHVCGSHKVGWPRGRGG